MWYFQLTEAATCLKKMMDLSFIMSFNFHYITLLKNYQVRACKSYCLIFLVSSLQYIIYQYQIGKVSHVFSF